MLIGPVALKLASTGYRFARYYTHSPPCRQRGAPALIPDFSIWTAHLSLLGPH